jgi:ribose transport system substrate-binding protein
MSRLKRNAVTFVSSVALSVSLVACGSSSGKQAGQNAAGSTPAQQSGTTVSLDVGAGAPIKVPTQHLRIGLFSSGRGDSWDTAVLAAATAEGQKYGYDVVNVPGNYDVQAQLNALQNAATTKRYDVILVSAVDGTVECNMLTNTLPHAGIVVGIYGRLGSLPGSITRPRQTLESRRHSTCSAQS